MIHVFIVVWLMAASGIAGYLIGASLTATEGLIQQVKYNDLLNQCYEHREPSP